VHRQTNQTGDDHGQKSKTEQSGTQEAESGKGSDGNGREDRIPRQTDAGAKINRCQEALRRSMGIRNTESPDVKSTQSLAMLQHPFSLSALDAEQTPGTYRMVVDEGEILGLPFLPTGASPPCFTSPHSKHPSFLVRFSLWMPTSWQRRSAPITERYLPAPASNSALHLPSDLPGL
jgi:hypothetical protein